MRFNFHRAAPRPADLRAAAEVVRAGETGGLRVHDGVLHDARVPRLGGGLVALPRLGGGVVAPRARQVLFGPVFVLTVF